MEKVKTPSLNNIIDKEDKEIPKDKEKNHTVKP